MKDNKAIAKEKAHELPKKTLEFRIRASTKLDKSGYILFEYAPGNELALSDGDTLPFKYRKTDIDVVIDKRTLITQKQVLADEHIAVLAFLDEQCTAKAVVPKEFYHLFDSFDFSNKLAAMQRFLMLPDSEKEILRQRLDGSVRYTVVKENPRDSKADSIERLSFRYDMTRCLFSNETQRDIDGLFEESRKVSSSNKEKAKRKLEYILGINQFSAPRILLKKEEIIAALDKKLYGCSAAKQQIAEAIVASKYSSLSGFNLLLVGSPGVGKSSIAKAVADVLNRPFHCMPLSSCTSLIDIVGDSSQYEAADAGEIEKAFYKAGTTAMVLTLDEFDKCNDCAKEGGNVSKAFNDMLSDEHKFKDVFVGANISTQNCIIIATANSIDTIPPHLLDRFKVINIEDYTLDEKVTIARDYLFPAILMEFGVDGDEIEISDDTIAYIASDFCEDEGARDMNRHLHSILSNVITRWDSEGDRYPVKLSRESVAQILDDYVDPKSSTIIFRRNRKLYAPQVASEITSLLAKLRRDDLDAQNRDKYETKLHYLVHLIPTEDAIDFDVDTFYEHINSTHYGLDKVKLELAQIFNAGTINKNPLTSIRLLLVGPPGIGKSSIIESIAAACHSAWAKISLNGVNDVHVIKGHSFTYTSADAGAIVKAAIKMQSTEGIIQLDEVDKMGTNAGYDVASALIDLLDDSAEFTDNFLSVPIDFSNTLFIATANDLSAVNPLLLDRFTIIHLDGYTEKEKALIIKNHIIPHAISELCPDVNISFTESAYESIMSYCQSFGVRDADKVVRRLVRDKLYISRASLTNKQSITKQDIKRVLGAPPAARGNFPSNVYPGLVRGLAVTGDGCGMSFAIETNLIDSGNGLTITGMAQESVVDSVKLATTYIQSHFPGKIANKGIHIHFAEGAVKKDGPSAGVAILLSLLSTCFDMSVSASYAFTGEINLNGGIFNIGGVKEKIQAAEQAGCSKVFIPKGNYDVLDKDTLELFSIEIIPVEHVSQVIDSVLPNLSQAKSSA